MNKKIKLAVIISLFCGALSLNSATLDTGLHMFIANTNQSLSVGDFTGDVDVLYSINNSKTGYKSFLPSNSLSFLNSLQSVEVDTGYLVKISTDGVNFSNYKSLTEILESDVILYSGLNIVNLHVMASIPLGMHYINGAKIDVIYSINNGRTGYKSYLPSNTVSFLNSLQSTEVTGVYLIKATGEINDVYITSALTADQDLASYTTENLNNKSILVMENNSGALKTSLITFDNNQTYKEVEVSGFSASTLSGTDADINATVSSAVSSLTTGSCGNWNFDSTDLYITPVSGTTIGATVQIANSADGNFTIGSIYKKVVYYGEAIDLSSVTDCQLDSFLLPPSVPGS